MNEMELELIFICNIMFGLEECNVIYEEMIK